MWKSEGYKDRRDVVEACRQCEGCLSAMLLWVGELPELLSMNVTPSPSLPPLPPLLPFPGKCDPCVLLLALNAMSWHRVFPDFMDHIACPAEILTVRPASLVGLTYGNRSQDTLYKGSSQMVNMFCPARLIPYPPLLPSFQTPSNSLVQRYLFSLLEHVPKQRFHLL